MKGSALLIPIWVYWIDDTKDQCDDNVNFVFPEKICGIKILLRKTIICWHELNTIEYITYMVQGATIFLILLNNQRDRQYGELIDAALL